MANYMVWSSFAAESGFLTRDVMLLGKGWLTDKAGWSLNYAAWAFSYKNSKLAWQQFMAQFDMMDETGRLPDSFNDSFIRWNHIKPPIQGWILSKMMKHMKPDRDQLIEAYLALGKATRWWMRIRNFRGEGLFIYDHAKDSAWDDGTVFTEFPPVITPELQAFLIIQMEMMQELSQQLGIEDEAAYWKKQAERFLANLIDRCFKDGLPSPIHANTGKRIENSSLMPYEVLILGERLPAEIREAAIRSLKENFRTEYGFATESPKSERYRSDERCLGAIWPPALLIILDGLDECGEKELVQQEIRKYLDMVRDQKLSECYDSATGKTAGPTLYTTTACTYLILLREYHQPN